MPKTCTVNSNLSKKSSVGVEREKITPNIVCKHAAILSIWPNPTENTPKLNGCLVKFAVGRCLFNKFPVDHLTNEKKKMNSSTQTIFVSTVLIKTTGT